ncbi:DUF262 domain-containing protein [Corynebacterium flavescens]|uniref:DUF262 domain-containing protein n=1 Tax=Corynebacterium flavescens TaxID=28028 RepID=UPI0026481E07|nr:DUF262 domain-containing protein [Corynebacterium flavescens]MDN6199427.1 DUF262 domain-containing HNH endonuclease family protein [Corynebacterium flavescens]MDN6226425.1 DUF262 domain-containing HNH endonuclease family protein [Corynebacterium flavescens]MDN6476200.1 DUF262 domain-containing HNH endonuclease family protein [Corynebacterium flavescens]MDN6687152.1 DUF262 domain-containing HNH endonuclease family protein [Corynebacterium flavescens]MDN6822252.1 DUF262 domain-containing HNH 
MAKETRRLEAAEISVGKLLTSGDFEFVIPEYQRPYAWGAEESLQLLSDLFGALDRDTDEPYFLGSIVLVKSPNDPRSEVIDGQQRITTLTLILSLLRDLADNDDLRRSIHSLIEKSAVEWDNKPSRPRLELRPRDNQFFYDFVQTMGNTFKLIELSDNIPETDSQRGLRDNAKALYKDLSALSPDRLKDLFRLIAGRAFLVTVSTPDLNSAYRIFSVMNARGLPLSPQDIFKSQVVGSIHESEKQHFADRWEHLEESLGRDEFGDLFLYIRAIKTHTRGVKSLLQEFPEQVLNQYLPSNGAGFIRDVLEPYARADIRLLAQDFQGEDSQWAQVNHWLKCLDQLDNDDWRPSALWALTNHGEDPEFLVKFFTRLERLAASMLIRRVYATPRQLRYMELLKQLTDGRGLDAPSFQLSDAERTETKDRIDGDIYLATRVRRYVLLRLDSILAQDPGASYDHRIITVEHVLPQTPAEDSQWIADFTDEDAAKWTHKLGNLLLLNRRVNSAARNYDFDVKKAKYFTSGKGVAVFALTTQVLTEPAWTPQVVERRQRELIKLLSKAWEI